MADDAVEDEPGSDREQGQAAAEKFAAMVNKVGGSTAAAKILKRSRGAVEKWAAGKSRLPFEEVIALAMHLDGNLDRFAIGADEDAIPSPPIGAVTDGEPPDGYVALPRLRVRAAAGSGIFLAPGDDDPGQFLAARATWLRSIGANPARTEALLAKGDSMEPTIRDGDVLLIDRSIDRVVDNGIYVVVIAGAVVVKRLTIRLNGAVVLSSDNPAHPSETVSAEEVNDLLQIEGRVRWCGRLM